MGSRYLGSFLLRIILISHIFLHAKCEGSPYFSIVELYAPTIDCTSITGSVQGPTGCNCYSHHELSQSFEDANGDCVSRAPNGFRARLAFVDDQATYDLLRALSSSKHRIGLRSLGDHSTLYPFLNKDEFSWTEDGITQKFPWTFVPAAGALMTHSSSHCIYIESNGQYIDGNCIYPASHFCEYLLSKYKISLIF